MLVSHQDRLDKAGLLRHKGAAQDVLGVRGRDGHAHRSLHGLGPLDDPFKAGQMMFVHVALLVAFVSVFPPHTALFPRARVFLSVFYHKCRVTYKTA